jgi:hypothetical protein
MTMDHGPRDYDPGLEEIFSQEYVLRKRATRQNEDRIEDSL